MYSLITINISGKIFSTQKEIISKSNLFKTMLEDIEYNGEIIYLYRSAHIFKHVYAFLIDHTYPYPKKYEGELKYYLIEYNLNNLFDSNVDIITELNTLKEQIKNIFKKCDEDRCENMCVSGTSYCQDHGGICDYIDYTHTMYGDYCHNRCHIDDKKCLFHLYLMS